ncbi:MAG TPA: nicotinate-nucleotide diphosphorylase [Gemmataceae bacterium]|nr:nicotinate-nucleotide diphosphorylase [Gemmataceae bacterium]
MPFSEAETTACRRLVEMALEEDLGGIGDITSRTFIPPKLEGRAVFIARSNGVVAGLPAAQMVFQTAHTPLVKFEALVEDGVRVAPGARLAVVSGLMEFILTGERTALNFLQHMSGIASLTRKYVDAIAGLPCKILDTRKTLPGWRLLEKYAVRQGGGHNHRMGLFDGILVKDNHLAAWPEKELFKTVILAIRSHHPVLLKKWGEFPSARILEETFNLPLEIEVENSDQLPWALSCNPDIVLLDNMSLGLLRLAVEQRNDVGSKALLEASGGVTLDTVRAIAETGVDRISIGALTHSALALDIALDLVRNDEG